VTSGAGRGKRRFAWARWPDEKLLDLRLCDLGVSIRGTWIEDCVRELQEELVRRGIRLTPHAWLSHDWFTPDGVPGIAIPFYLAHPRLIRLERRQMLEAEGSSREECMKILRHEAGHAVQQAFRLHVRRRWQYLFGRSSEPYPASYRPNPASRRYVQHLRLYYAQSHPDEDFAETFAVCLQPRSPWRRRYSGWPALRKLEYVDALIRELKHERPVVRTRRQIDPLRTLRRTLREYYTEKKEQYSLGYPDIYDRDLKRLFSDDPRHRRSERASRFLRRNRTEIRRLVSRWTGQYQFTLDQVMNDMMGRCRELKLRAVGPESRLRIDFAVLLTVKTMNFLYSRRNRIAL
jgi:hypothetical protein